MDADERDATLALALTPGIGPHAFRVAVDTYGSARAAWSALSHADTRSVVGQPRRSGDKLNLNTGLEAASAALDWAQGADAHLVLLGTETYPPQLAALADSPPVLFVCGDRHCLFDPSGRAASSADRGIAIVGSRNPTDEGRHSATTFSSELARAGLIIVSGLAQGIDALAHQAALDMQRQTVAVLATGVDVTYPRAPSKIGRTDSGRWLHGV